MEEQKEKLVNNKPDLKSSVSSFSADNESGYEDCEPSDVIDTINERTDHTGDLTNVTSSRRKHLETDHETDSLIETTSALTIDSSTRYLHLTAFPSLRCSFESFQATLGNLFCLIIYIVITKEVSEQNSGENSLIKHTHIKLQGWGPIQFIVSLIICPK